MCCFERRLVEEIFKVKKMCGDDRGGEEEDRKSVLTKRFMSKNALFSTRMYASETWLLDDGMCTIRKVATKHIIIRYVV
jgi:hypothetical protein